MHIDLQTLSVVTVFIAALLGALLVFAGLQNRSVRAPMWWGAAHIVNASGFALLTSRGTVPGFVTIDLANALVLFGYGLTWTGARVFDSRPIRPFLVLVAPLVWLLLCRIPVFADSVGARVIFASSMLALLTLLAAQEFWRGRGEPLMSRWPTVIVLIAHALILLVRVPAVLLSARSPPTRPGLIAPAARLAGARLARARCGFARRHRLLAGLTGAGLVRVPSVNVALVVAPLVGTVPGLLRHLPHCSCPRWSCIPSARDFRPLSAVSMIVFSALRFSMPIIGIRVPTDSS